jgi:prevent-host-death family protein
MKTVQATEAKNNFGKLLEDALVEPVTIQKNGRDIAVLVSKAQFDANYRKQDKKDDIRRILEESIERYGDVYRALAK